MPRQARIDAPGALHHIIARGMERREIFYDGRDRDDFLRRLGEIYLRELVRYIHLNQLRAGIVKTIEELDR